MLRRRGGTLAMPVEVRRETATAWIGSNLVNPFAGETTYLKASYEIVPAGSRAA
jgi:hypothetical protein